MNTVLKLIHIALSLFLCHILSAQAGTGAGSGAGAAASGASWAKDFEEKRNADFDINGNLSSTKKEELEKMAAQAPDEFAQHFAAWKLSKRNDAGVEHLLAAYNINKSFQQLWPEMLQWSLFTGDQKRAETFAASLVNDKILPEAILEYGRNTLASIQTDGILLVNGGNDTYAMEALRNLYHFREDVLIVDLSWVANPKYLEFLKSKGVNIPAASSTNEKIFQYLITLGRPVYIALSADKNLIQKNRKNLYCTGLAVMYSATEVNSIDVLRQNFEWRFARKWIAGEEPLNRNYIIPLCELIESFRASGLTANKEAAQQLLRTIAERFQLVDQVQSYLQ